jgi:aminoglycoside phosphotransferase (APT) family kinase protein
VTTVVPSRERHPNHRELDTLPVELRRTSVPPDVREWIHRETGAPVVRVRRLAGASTTAVHAIAVADGRRFVLRRYVWPGFLLDEPIAPQREVDALRFASRAGLPAPDVVAAALTAPVPAILMTFLPGRAVAVPDLTALAETAAAIHAVDAASFGHDYFPWYEGTAAGPPPGSTRPALWERAIETWQAGPPPYRRGLTHRDYHPGNVLWRRGHVTGVVDWANACRGPGGCDVAHCRTNLMELADVAVADEFQRRYETITGADHHPFWEIASVLEHGPSRWTGPELALDERRLAAALAALRR